MGPKAEAIHDAEIMPALDAISKRCQELGMSMVACVEWAPGKYSTTSCVGGDTCPQLRLGYTWLRSFGNFDSFAMAAMRHAEQHGHQSVILMRLGVPLTPQPSADAACERQGGG